MEKPSHTKAWNAASLLILGLGSGIFAGLVEGVGLMIFQRINWARWGPMMHVSWEIIWISPVVDAIFFLSLALVCVVVSQVAPRLPTLRVLVFLLTFLSVYDWITLTSRLYLRACLLLALGVAVAITRWCGKRESAFLQFWKKTTPWMVAGWLLAFAGTQGGRWLHERGVVANLPSATPGTPNVLVIVVDTLRADHVSSYGYAHPTTPNLDRLAQQGVRFDNAISPCSWSLPSHVSLLTGLYEFEHGVGSVQPEPWHWSFAPVSSKALPALTVEVLAAALDDVELAGAADVRRQLADIHSRYVCAVAQPAAAALAAARLNPAARPS